MSKTLLLFRYTGGKFYALKKLEPFWKIPHDEYREPLLGGGSVFFAKPKVKFNWLNDIHKELITTYNIISKSKMRNNLIRLIEKEKANKQRHNEIKNFKPKNDLEKAFKFFYLNRTSFSGKMRTPSWGYRPKRSLPPARWSERIVPCGQKLENVKFTSLDFEDVINAPSEMTVLMYVDPPYFSVKRESHYVHSFTTKDHIRLAQSLKKTKHKFFLTYDDCEEIRKLYKWAKIHPIEFYYRVDNSQNNNGKRKFGSELVITNHPIQQKIDLTKWT